MIHIKTFKYNDLSVSLDLSKYKEIAFSFAYGNHRSVQIIPENILAGIISHNIDMYMEYYSSGMKKLSANIVINSNIQFVNLVLINETNATTADHDWIVFMHGKEK